MGWHKVCHIEGLWEGEMLGCKINGYELVLLNVKGELRAYYGLCPHALGRLTEEGIFDGERLVCGVHLWEFDACSGKSINPCGAELPAFPVQVREGEVYVELPDMPAREWALRNLRFDAAKGGSYDE
jgi:toluene monooxygenase system ferredoxin subunit